MILNRVLIYILYIILRTVLRLLFILFISFLNIFVGDFSVLELFEDTIDINRKDKETIFVSLGSHCGPAGILRELGLRKCAFPFDWIVTSNTDVLIELLNNDFQGLLETKNLKRDVLNPGLILNILYDIHFLHEWHLRDLNFTIENCTDNIQIMKEKYERRIDRFRKLKNYQGRVVFIRDTSNVETGTTEEEAICLRDALDKFFPDLDFSLVVINQKEESVNLSSIDQDRIFELAIDKSSYKSDPSIKTKKAEEMFLYLDRLYEISFSK